MARGWESKSVEEQIDAAEVHRNAVRSKILSQQMIELARKKEGILLSRTRVSRELEAAQNPRYKTVLQKALAELDAQLSDLSTDDAAGVAASAIAGA
jgi:hypothetical protein